jgi:hypothetical protein
VSGDPLSAWREFCDAFTGIATKILRSTSVNINAASLRDGVKSISKQYMQQARPALARNGFEQELAVLDEHFKRLHELAEGNNQARSYKWRITAVRKALPKINSRLEMEFASSNEAGQFTPTQTQIKETLSDLVPTAGLSYQQALQDLADDARVSYRGPATELREVLREILDHLAPDADVMGVEGFKLEKDRTKPTMKQKVRFILKARGLGSTSSEPPERAAEAIDSIVGSLARSAYNFGSVVTHVAGERQAVVQLSRYVEAVLSHLLEL